MSNTLATLKIHVLKINAIFLFTAQLTCPSSDLGELSSRCGGNLMAVVIHTSATPLKLAQSTESVVAGVETACMIQRCLQCPKGW